MCGYYGNCNTTVRVEQSRTVHNKAKSIAIKLQTVYKYIYIDSWKYLV